MVLFQSAPGKSAHPTEHGYIAVSSSSHRESSLCDGAKDHPFISLASGGIHSASGEVSQFERVVTMVTVYRGGCLYIQWLVNHCIIRNPAVLYRQKQALDVIHL